MKPTHLPATIIYIMTVAYCALLGGALPGIDATLVERIPLQICGAVIAVVAIVIHVLTKNRIRRFESSKSPKHLLGLKIGTVGFVTASSGAIVLVYLSVGVGTHIVKLGIAIGFVGMAVHLLFAIRERFAA